MARSRSYDMTFEINGKVASSFNNVFNKATTNLNDLKKRSREAQREMARLGREFRNGKIHQSQYAEGTAKLARELKQLEGSQRRLNALKATFDSGMNKAKRAAGVAAVGSVTAATAVAVSSLNKAADFEAQMAKVSAVSSATATDFARLNAEAQKLGKSTVFSPTEAAKGMEYLALAGWKTDEIISAMPGMLNLAAAGALDLGRASDVTSDTMQAFGLSADKAGHAADVFAYAQANANTNVEMLGEGMKYLAPVANTFKWSLEGTTAGMMALANQGLKGSIAGQAFASSLSRLSKDNASVQKVMKKTNIAFFDAQGTLKPLPKLIKEIEKGMAGMTDKQKSATLTTLFGTEAVKHWSILLSTGSDELERMTAALEKSEGTAAKMSATMVDNYAGSLKLLQSNIEAAQIKFMEPVLPVFQKFFGGLAGNIDNNMSKIEKTGEVTAKILDDITAPFSTTKPIKPKIEPNMDPADAQKMINQYNQELEKYELFSNMDFGDKVIYMLDTATAKAEEWLGGSGGQAMEKIFSKLGEIAVKAFFGAFTGSLKAAGSNALNGNFAGALGMGAATWMLGGGALVKGAIGAGRWALEKRGGKGARKDSTSSQDTASVETASTKAKGKKSKSKRTKGAAQAATATLCEVTTAPTSSKEKKSKTKGTNKGSAKVAPKARQASALSQIFNTGKNVVKGGGKALTTVAKGIGKGFAPIGLAMGVHDIFKSKDKVKATAQTTGGFAGGLGGAKLGAAIGTAIAPGIGTTLGLLLGGAAGYIGGKWAGGKAVDTARGGQRAASQAPSDKGRTEATKSVGTTKLNAAATQLATTFDTTHTAFTKLETSINTTATNMDNLTMYTGQVSTDFVTSFASLKATTDLSNTNMSTLASTIGQASGWVSSIQGIQPAVQHVIVALNRLRTRIDNMQIQGAGGATSRRTQYE